MNRRRKHPVLHVPPSSLDIAAEVVAALGVVFTILAVVYYWRVLPDRIPTHFDMTGSPDAWGPKSTLLILPAVTAFMYVLLAVACRFPHTFNYPVQITPENAQRQYRIALLVTRWFKVEMIGMFAYIEWGWIQVALGRAESLCAAWVMPAFVVVMIAMAGLMIVLSYRAR
ncbi:unnamed protein product [marine sediment metagenome]|uniref:DUF1648 domain-containing protein n=1 Tax=marine sediment metagenome TaxID=412755 RepID=X0VZT9_9ZZZZ